MKKLLLFIRAFSMLLMCACASPSTEPEPSRNERIRELGLQELATIHPRSADIGEWKTWLADYEFNDEYSDDRYVWLTCVLALKAVNIGNAGIGCILIDGAGNVLVRGHNGVFNPYFRSDRHGEMVVMDEFEDTHQDITKLQGYTLYTSLESCPMCLTRLISSGVNTVLYAAPDTAYGMVHKMEQLPPAWIELAERQTFGRARCSQDLINAANDIFLLNIDEFNERLRSR
jgi:tRNA(Arg) A34 adenosine deaminase TadA